MIDIYEEELNDKLESKLNFYWMRSIVLHVSCAYFSVDCSSDRSAHARTSVVVPEEGVVKHDGAVINSGHQFNYYRGTLSLQLIWRSGTLRTPSSNELHWFHFEQSGHQDNDHNNGGQGNITYWLSIFWAQSKHVTVERISQSRKDIMLAKSQCHGRFSIGNPVFFYQTIIKWSQQNFHRVLSEMENLEWNDPWHMMEYFIAML